MDPFSIVWLLIIVLLSIFIIKAILHSIRFVFFLLLAVLAIIFFFGISWQDASRWLFEALLWVV